MYPLKTVAILTANAALSSILSMMLREERGLRVRCFADAESLSRYMRIAAVELLICDFDLKVERADWLVARLRSDELVENRRFQVIMLAGSVDRKMQGRVVRSGIDEVLVKPASPAHVRERVLSRLGADVSYVSAPTGYVGPDRRRLRDDAPDIEPVSGEVIDFAHYAKRRAEDRLHR